MATTVQAYNFILEHLNKIGNITTRKMMGEYLVYFKNKLVGNICDDLLYLKPTDSALRLLPDAERDYPYEGSKTQMIIVDKPENTELMSTVLHAMYEELPAPKSKTARSKK